MIVGGPEKRLSRGWLLLHRPGLRLLRELQESGQLKPVDVSIFLALLEFQTLSSGLVQGGARRVSRLPGMPSEVVVQYGIRRLQMADCIRRAGRRRSSHPQFAVNPAIATSGKLLHRAWHMKAWQMLEDAELPPPPTASVIKAGIA